MDDNAEIRAIRKVRRNVSFEVLPPNVSIVKLMGVHYAPRQDG